MKKEKIFMLIVLIFICIITNITVANALDKQVTTLASYKIDITGDNQLEKIQIKRNNEKNKIEIEIISATDKKYRIPLTGNQKPTLTFKDLNQDHVKDIFITNPRKDGMIPTEYQLFSLINNRLIKLELPESVLITAQYENDYKANIQINQSDKAYTMDLHDQKKSFDQMGLYQNGHLNEPTELIVNSIEKLEPVRLKGLTIGLKGRQSISEGYEGVKIAFVDFIWKWTSGTWELQKTVVKKVKKK